MKRHLFLIICLFISITAVNAEITDWGWTVGDAGMAYDIMNNSYMFNYRILTANMLINERLGIGTSLFAIENWPDNCNQLRYSIFPIELSYKIVSLRNLFYWTVFGRAEWQFIKYDQFFDGEPFFYKDNQFQGAIGSRFSFFKPSEEIHYSWLSSLFVEYTTSKEVKIGVSVDGLVLAAIVGAFFVAIFTSGEEKDKDTAW